MKKRMKRIIVIAVPVVLLVIVWWYLFLGSRITDGSSEVTVGEAGTRSLVVYFSREGEIPNRVDAVTSATPNSNKAMDGSDTEAAAKMIRKLIKEHDYFTQRGFTNEHGGGGLFASDEEIMGWLFSHYRLAEIRIVRIGLIRRVRRCIPHRVYRLPNSQAAVQTSL